MKFTNSLEKRHYNDLILREAAGEIYDIKYQHKFKLIIKGQEVGTYTIDFTYRNAKNGKLIGDETKGYFHVINRLRFKMFLAIYGEEFEAVNLQAFDENYYLIRLTKTGRIQGLINNKWQAWQFQRKKKFKAPSRRWK